MSWKLNEAKNFRKNFHGVLERGSRGRTNHEFVAVGVG